MFIESSDILSFLFIPITQRNSGQAPIKYPSKQGEREKTAHTSRLMISNLNLEGGTWEVPLIHLDSSAHRMSWVVLEIEFSVSARGREDIHSISG